MKPTAKPWGVIMARAELLALLAVASEDRTKPHLSCVVFRPDGVFATNAAALLAAPFDAPLPDREPVVIPRLALDRLARAIPKDGGIRLTVRSARGKDSVDALVAERIDVATWGLHDHLFEAVIETRSDLVLPSYDDVLAAEVYEPRHHPQFDVSRLQDLARLGELGIDEAARAGGYAPGHGAQLQIGSSVDGHPMRIEYHHGQQRWITLLMPLREK